MKTLYIVLLIVFINLQLIYAQSANRKSTDIQISVNTESIEKTIQPQDLVVEISKNYLGRPGFMSIGIENVNAGLTLVSSKLNNDDLWLINSSTSSTNEKVIAWEFDEENSRILLYPYNWNSPYILELNIQVNLKNLSLIENYDNANVILTSEISNELVDALPTGNGNVIQIK